jgi:hypothetical protein
MQLNVEELRYIYFFVFICVFLSIIFRDVHAAVMEPKIQAGKWQKIFLELHLIEVGIH